MKFSEIKKQIGYNGEWSVAFGMHPAVIEYNGCNGWYHGCHSEGLLMEWCCTV